MAVLKWLLLLGVLTIGIESLNIPSYITFCKRNDPKLGQCLLNVSRNVIKPFCKGIPELGVEPIDPLFVSSIDIKALGGVEIGLRNTSIYGLSDADMTKMEVDVQKKKVHFKFSTSIVMKGQYKMNGRILLLPIQGEGDYTIKIARSYCSFKYDYHLVPGKDGALYGRLDKDDLKCRVGKVHFDLQNLFGGDRILGGTVNAFLNQNFEETMKELIPPVIFALKEETKKRVMQFSSNIPYDTLLPLD